MLVLGLSKFTADNFGLSKGIKAYPEEHGNPHDTSIFFNELAVEVPAILAPDLVEAALAREVV